MDHPEPKGTGSEGPGAGWPSGAHAPAKGESSASDVPPRPDQPAAGPSTPSDPELNTLADDVTLDSSPRRPSPGSRQVVGHHRLRPGDLFGGRYEIRQVLGEGGMGTVYKAWDREVEHLVALKLIRTDLADEPVVLARFKQELLTARQVTHRNVIRIYDLSELDGMKFITMEFVEGGDLRKLLHQKRKLPPEEAVEIMRQVCLALEAAHGAGIIHRDLKPQNIMQDRQGRILVMDFGLARSLASDGMTQTGALLGTVEYMSPEQAMGKHLDARSDLFTLGLIFYELLTGNIPYKADTAMASLLKRNQERAVPATELDSSIPKGLSDIVSKCLERDLSLRYQRVEEILADLDAWEGKRPVSASVASTAPETVVTTAGKPVVPWKWIVVGVLAVALGVGGWAVNGRFGRKPAAKVTAGAPQASLVILPFHNRSTDQSADWIGPSIRDILSTSVGQSQSVRIVSVDQIRQILSDLRIPANADLDDQMLKRIAELSGASTVVSGQYAKFGQEIRIDATLFDLKQERRAPLKEVQAASENAIPKTVDGLAEQIRANLAVSADVLKELKASSFQPSSNSVAALREFNRGVELQHDGRNMDAAKAYQAAIKADPQFALAYARLAESSLDLGYDADAEQYSRKAVDLSQSLSSREKYLIDASHSRIMRDYPKAIPAYENLAKAAPGDLDVQYTLGTLYEDTGAYQKAREQYAAVLKAEPQSVEGLWKMGGVEIMSDNPQGSLDYLNRGLTLSIQSGNDERKAVILQALGIAYRLMDKPEEALRSYQEALAIERRIGFKRGVAASLNEMGQVYSLLGRPDAALASFNEAIQVRKAIGAKKEAGDTLIDLGNFYEDRGQHEQALKMFQESLAIQRDAGDQTYQALCLNNIGSVYLANGHYDDALTYFQQALQLREKLKVPGEIVETVYNLGQTNTKMGQYDQALSQYLRSLELYRSLGDKRGAAIASYKIGSLFGLQGRYGAAVSSEEEAVKAFREIQDRSATMAEILSGYGGALADAGRAEEAHKALEEALSLAREVKASPVVAQSLNFQGNAALYRGEFASAGSLYGQALETASQIKNRDQVLESKIGQAKAAIAQGRAREASKSLPTLTGEADSLGSKYLSVESSVELGEALLNSKDYARARQELEATLGRAEKLGLRALLARNHYLLAATLRAGGDGAEASGHYRDALRLLDEIRKEAGAEKTMERADLKPIYEECTRWSGSDSK
jgi:tetratricopeptide (TPR) repeat protein/predicted Ser/Thr protein kinase